MRLATAACMQKYGNVSFVTVVCAKCMRYGGGWGTIPLGGGVGIRDPDSYMDLKVVKVPNQTKQPTVIVHIWT